MDDITEDHGADQPPSEQTESGTEPASGTETGAVVAPAPTFGAWEAQPPPPPPSTPDPPAPPDPPGPPPGGWAASAGSGPGGGEHRRALRRSPRNRILGGVAAGLAEYLDIDVVIVRIAFVALAVLGGSGLLLYVAGWLLIPGEDSGRAVVQDFMERRPRRRSLVAIVLGTVVGIIALSNLFSSGPWWRHWDGGAGGFGFFFGLSALALAVVLVVKSGRGARSPLRWVFLTTLLAVVAVAVVAIATVFSVEALSGVPLSGGVGNTQWRPTAAAQVQPRYRLAIGTMRVDLSDVTFGPGTTHVTASVGIGNLVVELPHGTAVSVAAHSGMGVVQVFGQNEDGFATSRVVRAAGPRAMSSATATTGVDTPRIVLDAQTGVGKVQVIRAGP
ncbi:MAG TPA: PspC domain-containing protein [Acidimicrobiales bacterium]